jgi:hypothetical protein
MTSNDCNEATLAYLSRLPILSADPTRAERTRRRCRALLGPERRRKPLPSRIEFARPGVGAVIVSAFCVFCIMYVSALVATAFRVQGLLR